MTGTNIHHALGLHMHQPPGNLRLLIDTNPWEAEQIVRCYERAVRYARDYRDVARLHVGFSGVLLEQLLDPDIVDRYRHILDIPAMLQSYREADNIELIGMGTTTPYSPSSQGRLGGATGARARDHGTGVRSGPGGFLAARDGLFDGPDPDPGQGRL